MNPELHEWIKLVLRWVHVFSSILWVGTTYFFTWLDGRFVELEAQAKAANAEKEVWMVHSGGFYRVEKQKVPNVMPEKLHWFRWEAAITWLSGLLLFALVYYHGGLMVSLEDARIKPATAIWLSVALILLSVPIYDLLWFKLVKSQLTGVVISYLIIVALCFLMAGVAPINLDAHVPAAWQGLFDLREPLFTGRAAYLQLGAMLGTIMTANVWMRILPAQRRMVAALKAGQEPNQAEALRAKTCSKHNTFIVLPVVFIMISNHFPTITYGHRYNWAVLSALVLAGWWAARIIRRA
jgi:uncharacterized membrane protein